MSAAPQPDNDPLACGFPLPFEAVYYPMGFGVEIATNSRDILSASDAVWSRFPRLSAAAPVRLRVAVSGTPAGRTSGVTMRGQENQVSIVESISDFAVADLARGFSFAWLTPKTAADPVHTRYYFLEPLAYLMLDALYFVPIHASCVALGGAAVVLCGDSGAGKTSVAYECARRGWKYLSDDATHVLRGSADYTVVGRPYHIRFRHSAVRLFPELSSFAPARRPNGKLDLEIETDRLGLSVAFQSKAREIVFLVRRSSNGSPRVRQMEKARARSSLQQVICYGDGRIRAEQAKALDRFLDLPCFELAYSDTRSAEDALRSLAG